MVEFAAAIFSVLALSARSWNVARESARRVYSEESKKESMALVEALQNPLPREDRRPDADLNDRKPRLWGNRPRVPSSQSPVVSEEP